MNSVGRMIDPRRLHYHLSANVELGVLDSVAGALVGWSACHWVIFTQIVVDAHAEALSTAGYWVSVENVNAATVVFQLIDGRS